MFLCFKIVYCIIYKLFYNKENKEVIDQELKEQYKKLNQEELNDLFINACKNDNLDIVKYLLTSSELTEHADIHAINDEGFIWACDRDDLEVVKCLIIDMSIEKTIHIETYLNENKDNENVQQAIELFNTRDLHHQLNENIKDNKEKVRKIKI